MMIDPESHLLLHRATEHERERQLAHRVAIRERREATRSVRARPSTPLTRFFLKLRRHTRLQRAWAPGRSRHVWSRR